MVNADRRALAIVNLSASKFGTTTRSDLEKSIIVQKGEESRVQEAIRSHK